MRYFFYAVILFLTLGASDCDQHRVKIDPSVMAVQANDYTVIISGCGNQPAVGYTYCRVRENAATEPLSISVHLPPAACPEQSCATVKVYDVQGQVAFSSVVPRGTLKQSIKWSELVKQERFERNHRGFWAVVVGWKYIGPDGRNYSSVAFGEVRMRVLAAEYEALHNSRNNANFVWSWSEVQDQFALTTSGRASTWRNK